MTTTIAVYLCSHTVLSSLGAALDCFHLANRLAPQPLFKVQKLSIDGQPVNTAYGAMHVDGSLADCVSNNSLLLLPAIGQHIDSVLKDNQGLLDWLQQHPQQTVASLCSAAFLMAAAGILDHHRATTHWALAGQFRQRFPRVRLAIEQLITHDQQRLCSGGANAGIDLCLYIIKWHGGDWLARQVASALVMDYGRGLQTRFVPRVPPPQSQYPAIAQLQRWLEQHYAEALSLDLMAQQLHCSPRTLLRHFKEATDITPYDYVQRVRISVAEGLLMDASLSIDDIAERVGYENRAAFAKLFKQVTGETPAAYRQRYGGCRGDLEALSA